MRVLEHTLGMQPPIEIFSLMHMGDCDCDIPDPPTSRAVAAETPHRRLMYAINWGMRRATLGAAPAMDH